MAVFSRPGAARARVQQRGKHKIQPSNDYHKYMYSVDIKSGLFANSSQTSKHHFLQTAGCSSYSRMSASWVSSAHCREVALKECQHNNVLARSVYCAYTVSLVALRHAQAGLCRTLHSMREWGSGSDHGGACPLPPSSIFPRCFDLSDPSQVDDFKDNFRQTAAASVLKVWAPLLCHCRWPQL